MGHNISVVVPTYGRAHLLRSTIPTLLQASTLEVIIVDDCSPDETKQVVAQLSEEDGRIRYIRNEKNRKQTYSKNVGISLARGEYIYFADDDSLVTDDAFSYLLDTLHKSNVDLVGASAVYLCEGEVASEAVMQRKFAENIDDIVNLPDLYFNFGLTTLSPVEVPLCQAAFLVRKSAITDLYFDTSYIGNCYREETDFLVRYRARGGRIVFDPRAVQINLPPSQATGGARGRSRVVYEIYSIYNTIRFIILRRKILKKLDVRCRPLGMIIKYINNRMMSMIKRYIYRTIG